jgi:hypothetical protein
MSRRGNCWDNAVAESFFATLKVELVREAAWATRAQARTELFEYLEVFCNGQRRHSALGYLSPRACEAQAARTPEPWCLRNRGKSIEADEPSVVTGCARGTHQPDAATMLASWTLRT